MANRTYTDFDLLIDRAGDKYRARVINSPDGPASNEFVLPFSDDKLENFILRISQGRRNIRNLRAVEGDASREFGAALFRTIFDGDVDVCLRNSITSVEQSGGSLRVRLRLSDVPELVDIPWEYLYDPTGRRFLALSVDTPLVRYLDLPGRIKPLAVQPPLSVLVMIACPSDVAELDVDQEWKKLKIAVADLEQQGLLRMDRLEKATLNALQQQLRRQEYHVFHFIGHGGFDAKTNDGILMLEDEDGRGKAVSGQTLGTLIHDERTLRLAFLNACEGGRTSKTDPFAGVGQSLLQQGVPAVIAMQFEVTDDTAITLAHSFYAALADGYPVDAALTEARKTIFARNAVEWGTPVLYMRAPDGRIFDVANLDSTAKTQNQVAALVASAQAALLAKTWPKAEDLFNQVIALDPTNSAAAAGLTRVHQGISEEKTPPAVPLGGAVPVTKRSRNGLFLGVGGVLLALLIGWLVWDKFNRSSMAVLPPTAPLATATVAQAMVITPTEKAQAQITASTVYTPPTQTATPLAATATTEPVKTPIPPPPSNTPTSAPPTSTPTTVPVSPISQPDEAVRSFLLGIADGVQTGNFRSAYALYNTRQSYQDFTKGYVTTRFLTIESIQLTQANTNNPIVEAIIIAADEVKAEWHYARYVSQYTLTKVSGTWRINRSRSISITPISGCPGSAKSRLQKGKRAYVLETPPTPNAIYEKPGEADTVIDKIQPGHGMTVKDGPRCINAMLWWYVESIDSGERGWTSEGKQEQYWLAPGDNPNKVAPAQTMPITQTVSSPAPLTKTTPLTPTTNITVAAVTIASTVTNPVAEVTVAPTIAPVDSTITSTATNPVTKTISSGN